MSYNSAKEFADIIKADLYEYGAEPEDLEQRKAALKHHYANEVISTLYDFDRQPTPTDTLYNHIIRGIMVQFAFTLPEELQEKLMSYFYFTTIDNRYLNPCIKRSPDGRFYAIFINSSLINILHKLGKLKLAVQRPDLVEFCSRIPEKPFSRIQMAELYAENYIHFKYTKLALGPQILLNRSLDFVHYQILTIQEKLMVFHEFGHFLNGDLEEKIEKRKLSYEYPNHSYQREHHADLVGFALLLRMEKHFGQITPEDRFRILLALIDLHVIQHDIQGGETKDYPHPLNRLTTVINCFYGKATADLVAQLINDDRLHALSSKNLPPLDSRESKFEQYVEQQLKTCIKKLGEF